MVRRAARWAAGWAAGGAAARWACLAPALGALLLVAAGALPRAAGGEPQRVLKPVHAPHAEAGVDCRTCHAAADTATTATVSLLPAMQTCGECHDIDSDKNCGMCHVNPSEPVAPRPITDQAQLFSHAAHLQRGLACERCHGPAAAPVLAGMAGCRQCHPTVSGQAGCRSCHAESERLLPVTHEGRWDWYHGVDARASQLACEACHTQTDCQQCHAGDNVRPRTHPLNYAFSHALDAQGDELACAECHQERDFCVECHVARRVIPQDHSRGDWVLAGSGGGRHAEEGELDIESCMACHQGGAGTIVCAECHGK